MSTSISQRVSMACSVCRKRKVKCITDSCDMPCLRCKSNGLRCQYIATERQARSLSTHCDPESPKPRRRDAYGSATSHIRRTPRPSSRNASPTDVSRPMPTAIIHNPGTSGLYRPPHQRSPVYSTFPAQPPPTGAYDELEDIVRTVPMLTPTLAAYQSPMPDPYLSPYPSPLDFPTEEIDMLGYAYPYHGQIDSYAQNVNFLSPSPHSYSYYMPQAIGC